MHRDVIDCFLGTQDFTRQAEVLVGRIERYSRETCKDDWRMPHEIQFLGFDLALKYRTLHDMGSRFGEFLRQALECFCRYDCKRGILLSSGYNATVE